MEVGVLCGQASGPSWAGTTERRGCLAGSPLQSHPNFRKDSSHHPRHQPLLPSPEHAPCAADASSLGTGIITCSILQMSLQSSSLKLRPPRRGVGRWLAGSQSWDTGALGCRPTESDSTVHAFHFSSLTALGAGGQARGNP